MPGIVAGALMAFTLSIDDFVITFFTAGVGASTLPLQIYSMIKVAVTPEVNAVSTLLMLLTLFLIVVLIFGATRIPQLGKGLGEGASYFHLNKDEATKLIRAAGISGALKTAGFFNAGAGQDQQVQALQQHQRQLKLLRQQHQQRLRQKK